MNDRILQMLDEHLRKESVKHLFSLYTTLHKCGTHVDTVRMHKLYLRRYNR